MAYIGREPQVGNFQVCDAISVVNGQAAYTMQVSSVNVSPETANHMLVSLNGVLQAPGSSYTVSGSTITFASNLVTGDVIDFIHILGSVLDLGVPSDSTVSLAKLTATGTKDATTFLRGDNTFAAPAAAGASDSFQAVGGGGSATHSGNLIANTEVHDDGNNYDTSTGRYTAPTTGYYLFMAGCLVSGSAGQNFYLTKNNSAITSATSWGYNGTGNQNASNVYGIVYLTSGQYAGIYSTTSVYTNQYLYFGGCKLY